ncbi:IS66 family insertion sequence element accessory protein TnpB [Neisseriaceae bacterium TC5R-5]|nr:IS66 family insertion sequence element accessory protein TnpB [Neisseriaceae bacterium TC5R-5]
MSNALSPEQVFLAIEPVDIRRGIDGLSAILQESLGQVPTNGHAYAFRNRAGNRIKLLIWDGTGVWMCVRRLHKGRFVWPQRAEPVFSLSQADWQWLTTGVDWQRLSAHPSALWRV